MKNLLILTTLFFLFLNQACVSIPKIQEGGFVEKITTTDVHLKNGQNLKIAKRENSKQTTIILVRHAEKMKDTKDPGLTDAGMERAENLKNILSTISIDHIFSTDYLRAQLTVAPTATSKSLKIESYDPKEMRILGQLLLDEYRGKTVLVSGHSNTTPNLLNFLMKENVVTFIDELDYDNLFVVTVRNDKRKALLVKY